MLIDGSWETYQCKNKHLWLNKIKLYVYKNIKLHLHLKYYTENFFNKFYILKSQRRNNVYYDMFKHSGAFIIQWGEADSFAA